MQDRTKGINFEPSNQETRGGKVKMVLCKDKCVSGCKVYHLPGTTPNSQEVDADICSLSAHANIDTFTPELICSINSHTVPYAPVTRSRRRKVL